MPVQRRQLFKPQDQAGIDRQRQMAEALQIAGMQGAPRSWNNMRVMPTYGPANAIADALQGVAAGYLQKKATEAEKELDARQRKEIADAMGIDDLTKGYEEPSDGVGPVRDPNNLPAAREKQAALRQFNQVLPIDVQREIFGSEIAKRAFPAPPKKFNGTLSQGEIGFVEGEPVAFGQDKPAAEPELMQGVDENGNPVMVPKVAGAVPYIPPREQDQEQRYSPETRTMPDGTQVDGKFDRFTGEWTPTGQPYKPAKQQLSAKDRGTARTKLIQLTLAKRQLAKIKESFEGTPDDPTTGKKGKRGLRGSLAAGIGGNLVYSENGKIFDSDVDAFRETIQGLLRVPGIGANSDFETRLSQAKLPTRNDYENVIANRISALEDIVNTLEQGYGGLLEDAGPDATVPAQPGAGPGGGAAPAGPPGLPPGPGAGSGAPQPPPAPRFQGTAKERANMYKQQVTGGM